MSCTLRAAEGLFPAPHTQFCPNPACPARGARGLGNIVVHSQWERRYRCTRCGKTFADTYGTPFYRKHYAKQLMTLVVRLMAHGCPLQAIVVAFGLDQRTVASWVQAAGQHCAGVHEHLVQAGRVDTRHVQADELWVKLVGQRVWQAMAVAVESRLWLGGVLSPTRDLALIERLAQRVRASVQCLDVLVCVDGLSSYVRAVLRAFRTKVPREGRRGRCRLQLAAGLQIGQMIKRYSGRRVVAVVRRVVRGSAEAIRALLAATASGTDINTAYIERLNATFRSRWAALARRSRRLAKTMALAEAGMWLVGTVYNFCTPHASLNGRTPALAAGLTDTCWTAADLLHYKVPPPPWQPPKRRGRPPKAKPQPDVRRPAV